MLSPLTFIAQKHWLLLFDQGITSVFLRYLILLFCDQMSFFLLLTIT